MQQSLARPTARSLRLVGDAQVHDDSMAVEIWERKVNVSKHYRERLQDHVDARALCQVVKTGADSRQHLTARYGPNAKCSGRNHPPGVTCYYCMTFPDRSKLKLKDETGVCEVVPSLLGNISSEFKFLYCRAQFSHTILSCLLAHVPALAAE